MSEVCATKKAVCPGLVWQLHPDLLHAVVAVLGSVDVGVDVLASSTSGGEEVVLHGSPNQVHLLNLQRLLQVVEEELGSTNAESLEFNLLGRRPCIASQAR